MIQFFAPDIETTLTLPREESGHCVKVLRRKPGDKVFVTDGKGTRFRCRLTLADPRGAMVEILDRETIFPPQDVHIDIAVAPSKNMDRMEWFVEKAVEIGVNRIILMKCDRSERKTVKRERLQKIAISAMNQSLKARVPDITEITGLSEVISVPFEGQKFFGYCSDEVQRRELVREYKPDENVLIMIGPEGDFSPREVEEAMKRGFQPVTFGRSRLRTETAALYAVQAIHIINDLTRD